MGKHAFRSDQDRTYGNPAPNSFGRLENLLPYVFRGPVTVLQGPTLCVVTWCRVTGKYALDGNKSGHQGKISPSMQASDEVTYLSPEMRY